MMGMTAGGRGWLRDEIFGLDRTLSQWQASVGLWQLDHCCKGCGGTGETEEGDLSEPREERGALPGLAAPEPGGSSFSQQRGPNT